MKVKVSYIVAELVTNVCRLSIDHLTIVFLSFFFQLVTEITIILEEVTIKNIINGTRRGDKHLMSMIANGLSNLAAADQYVNDSIKVLTKITITKACLCNKQKFCFG